MRHWSGARVSVYGINKVCYLIQSDLNFREQMKRDPAQAMVGFPLTDEERQAIIEGNVSKLYEAGAHSFLLSRLPRFESAGLTRQRYIRNMRTLLTPEEREELEGKGRG
jgi:Aromatic-ring-opening dioxygenase LigAB, LigA subunit